MPLEPSGQFLCIDLPDYIAYLYQINSKLKTRIV